MTDDVLGAEAPLFRVRDRLTARAGNEAPVQMAARIAADHRAANVLTERLATMLRHQFDLNYLRVNHEAAPIDPRAYAGRAWMTNRWRAIASASTPAPSQRAGCRR